MRDRPVRPGDSVRFRLGDSELAPYIRAATHGLILTGDVVHISNTADVDVHVPGWAALHTVPATGLLPALAQAA